MSKKLKLSFFGKLNFGFFRSRAVLRQGPAHRHASVQHSSLELVSADKVYAARKPISMLASFVMQMAKTKVEKNCFPELAMSLGKRHYADTETSAKANTLLRSHCIKFCKVSRM